MKADALAVRVSELADEGPRFVSWAVHWQVDQRREQEGAGKVITLSTKPAIEFSPVLNGVPGTGVSLPSVPMLSPSTLPLMNNAV